MIVRKSAIVQYFWIYIMLVFNQSNLYRYFLLPYRILIVGLLGLLVLLKYKSIGQRQCLYIIFLFGSVVLVRLINGGTGMETFADYAIPILAAFLAVEVDEDMFLHRFINTVAILAIISLAGFLLSFLFPAILRQLPINFQTGWGTSVWSSATDYVTTYYNGYGAFVFSWIDRPDVSRNIGIYTEPGVYQMVLNAAIAGLLFFNDRLYMTDKIIRRYLILFILTLITCASTSGFIGLAVIFLCYLFHGENVTIELRNRILKIICAASIVLAIDYLGRRDDSVVYSVILTKLFTDTGSVSLTASSSGLARMGTIVTSFQAMLTHPFGLGTIKSREIILSASFENVAGALAAFGAVMGLIPFVVTLLWLLSPIFKSNRRLPVKIVVTFLYFNTALAQSSPFYPTIIMYSIIMWYEFVGANQYEEMWTDTNINDYTEG